MLPSSIAIVPCRSRAPGGPVTSTSKVDRPPTRAGTTRLSSAIDAVPSSRRRPAAPSSTPTLPEATIVEFGPLHSKVSTCSRPSSNRSAVVRWVLSLMLPAVRAPPCSCTRARTASRRGADAVPSTVRFSVPVRSDGGSSISSASTGATATVDRSEKLAGSAEPSPDEAVPSRSHHIGMVAWPETALPSTVPAMSLTWIVPRSASATTFTPLASSCSPRWRVASSRVACPVGWNVSRRAPRNTSALTVPSAVTPSGTSPGASAVMSATGPLTETTSSAPVTAAGDRPTSSVLSPTVSRVGSMMSTTPASSRERLGRARATGCARTCPSRRVSARSTVRLARS